MITTHSLKAGLATIALSFVLTACSDSSQKELVVAPNTSQSANEIAINELWAQNMTPLLSQELWSARDKYDTANILLQPMQYAFVKSDADKVAQLDGFFTQLDSNFDEAITDSRVSTAQFMYFVSEYLALKTDNNEFDATSLALTIKLETWLVEFVNSPAWMWARDPFDTLAERTDWKLATKTPAFSYYRAMFDEDLFAYGIYANLVHVARKQSNFTSSDAFTAFAALARPQLEKILTDEVEFTTHSDGQSKFHWLFQPGVWWQHPDYQHAGNLALGENLEVFRIENIATDTSHMHRWPVWLKTYNRAFYDNVTMQSHISLLQTGLAQQFNEYVYAPSDADFKAPRVNNFFDGRNGVFRYQYVTQGDTGYGPYQLSAIVFAGWFGNLANAEGFVTDIKALLENNMSLSQQELATFVGPNTTRERNPYFVWPDYFTNGVAELNLRVSLYLLEN